MGTNLPVVLPKLSLKQKLFFGGGVMAMLAVATPVALLALKTITSIAMAMVVGLALFMGFLAMPALLRWWKIIVFKMMKASARLNPVETLQLELISRKQALDVAGAKVVRLKARRASLREKLSEFEKKHGAKDASLAAMQGCSTL